MTTPHKLHGADGAGGGGGAGITSGGNTRGSTVADYSTGSTTVTNYTPDLERKPAITNDLVHLIGCVHLSAGPRVASDDPFVGETGGNPTFALSGAAGDYAPAASTNSDDAQLSRDTSLQSSPCVDTPIRVIKPAALVVANSPADSVTRYIKVTAPKDDDSSITRIKDVKTMELSIATKKTEDGDLIFRFDHINEAKIACNATRSLLDIGGFPTGWSADYCPAHDFHGDNSRDLEGQVKVHIVYQGAHACDENMLQQIAINLVEASSEIVAYEVLNSNQADQMLTLELELASMNGADKLAHDFNNWKPVPGHAGFNVFAEHKCARYPTSSRPWVSSRNVGAYGTFNMSAMGDKRDSKVHLAEIQSGKDCRTTIMIRNIPNKIDAQMFKSILDEHVHGKYDFSYLRIDFSNNCNVGYAFVNFKDPRDIMALYTGLVGKPWEVFSSDKIADVCYATNQGLGTCVEKFRNSSVMLEWPCFRPKLWYTTEDGPQLAGKEKPFPEPSNLQKLHRSRANAGSIGLFPPRGLQESPTRGARDGFNGYGMPTGYPQLAQGAGGLVRMPSGLQVVSSQMMQPIPGHSMAYTNQVQLPFGGAPFNQRFQQMPVSRSIATSPSNPDASYGFSNSAGHPSYGFPGPTPAYGHPYQN